MEHRHYEVVVVGSGAAGQRVATATAQAGLRTAVVDKRIPGGTCALRGCDPKDFLIDVAQTVRRTAGYQGSGATALELGVDWFHAIEAKRRLIARRPAGVERQLTEAGIDLVRGNACFVGPDRLAVDGRTLSATHIVLDCGARPRPLDLPGADLAVTSEGFLDLDYLPQRMICIGGGYIGMEFGCLAAAAGVQVTVVTPGRRPLEYFSPTLVDRLVEAWSGHGLEICTDCSVIGLAGPLAGDAGKDFHVELSNGETRDTDLVLHAAGRAPATQDLAAELGEVELIADGGVAVDCRTMRSRSNPRVWAIGDCAASGRLQLTPVATREADLAIAGILERPKAPIDASSVTSAAFTMPPLTRVGLLPAEAPDAEVIASDLSSASWVRSRGESVAGLELVVDRSSDRLLGAHLLGPHAEEVINLYALMLAEGIPFSRLQDLLPVYPSFSSLSLGRAEAGYHRGPRLMAGHNLTHLRSDRQRLRQERCIGGNRWWRTMPWSCSNPKAAAAWSWMRTPATPATAGKARAGGMVSTMSVVPAAAAWSWGRGTSWGGCVTTSTTT
jgi:glutathione reductase (NADPH)